MAGEKIRRMDYELVSGWIESTIGWLVARFPGWLSGWLVG